MATDRQPFLQTLKAEQGTNYGPDLAARGILPPRGGEHRGDETSGCDIATRRAVQQRLPDGRVIFAMSAGFAHPADPGKDSIKAVTWTNADGTQDRVPLAQEPG